MKKMQNLSWVQDHTLFVEGGGPPAVAENVYVIWDNTPPVLLGRGGNLQEGLITIIRSLPTSVDVEPLVTQVENILSSEEGKRFCIEALLQESFMRQPVVEMAGAGDVDKDTRLACKSLPGEGCLVVDFQPETAQVAFYALLPYKYFNAIKLEESVLAEDEEAGDEALTVNMGDALLGLVDSKMQSLSEAREASIGEALKSFQTGNEIREFVRQTLAGETTGYGWNRRHNKIQREMRRLNPEALMPDISAWGIGALTHNGTHHEYVSSVYVNEQALLGHYVDGSMGITERSDNMYDRAVDWPRIFPDEGSRRVTVFSIVMPDGEKQVWELEADEKKVARAEEMLPSIVRIMGERLLGPVLENKGIPKESISRNIVSVILHSYTHGPLTVEAEEIKALIEGDETLKGYAEAILKLRSFLYHESSGKVLSFQGINAEILSQDRGIRELPNKDGGVSWVNSMGWISGHDGYVISLDLTKQSPWSISAVQFFLATMDTNEGHCLLETDDGEYRFTSPEIVLPEKLPEEERLLDEPLERSELSQMICAYAQDGFRGVEIALDGGNCMTVSVRDGAGNQFVVKAASFGVATVFENEVCWQVDGASRHPFRSFERHSVLQAQEQSTPQGHLAALYSMLPKMPIGMLRMPLPELGAVTRILSEQILSARALVRRPFADLGNTDEAREGVAKKEGPGDGPKGGGGPE